MERGTGLRKNQDLAVVKAMIGLKKKFSLDELELRILLDAKKQTFQEIAGELGELPLVIEARTARSIPVKLEVRNLREARIKLKRELERELAGSLRR